MSDGDPPPQESPPPLDPFRTHLDSRGGARGTTLPAGERPFAEEADRIGRYPVSGALGVGGMGEVWEVADPDVGRPIALKRMRISGAEAEAKFLREARITGRLEHPGIIPLYELGRTPDGAPYFTMKRVQGLTLADQMDAGETTLREHVRVLLRVCDAVAFAHSRQVIHRDLKPDNIMVGDFGEVLVMDWGLAKTVGEAELGASAATTTDDGRATLDGTVMGTLAYMPPEQARGDIAAMGPPADTYALGAILYEILTGSTPYGPADSAREALALILEGPPPPPSQRRPGVPRELEAVALRAMAREPADRYADVRAMQADLDAWLAGHTLEAARYTLGQRLAKWAGRNWRPLAAAAAVLALTTAVGGYLYRQAAATRHAEIRQAREDVTRWHERIAAWKAETGAPETLDAALADQRRRDPDEQAWPAEAARWRALLPLQLNHLSALERLRQLDPPDRTTLARARRQAHLAVGRTAMLAGDFGVARWAFSQLPRARHKTLASALAERSAWRERARLRAREARLTHRARRIANLLEQLRTISSARRSEHWELDDYVIEVVAYDDGQTVRLLDEELRRLAHQVTRDPNHEWTEGERVVIAFCCRVLSRLARVDELAPAAVGALARWAAAPLTPGLLRDAGRALCRTGRASALVAVFEIRRRIGVHAPAWRRLATFLARLPLTPDPRTAADYHQRALTLIARRQGNEALECFREALQREPDNIQIHCDLIDALDQLGDHKLLISEATSALTTRRGSQPEYRSRLLTLRGRANYVLHRPIEARSDFDAAIATRDSPFTRLERGRFYFALGLNRLALADYDVAVRRWPNDPTALALRGAALVMLQRYDEARAVLERGLALDPRDPRLLIARARLLLRRGRPEQARADIHRAIALQGDFHDGYIARAELRRIEGQLKAARADIDRALELSPGTLGALLLRAIIRAQMNDPGGALADAALAEEGGARLEAHTIRAKVYVMQRDWTRALAECDKAIAAEPEMLELLNLRALLRRRTHDLRGARQDLATLTRLQPGYAEAWINYADICLAMNDRAEARRAIDKAKKLAPNKAMPLILSAMLRCDGSRDADHDTALAELDRAIAIEPGSARAFHLRARILHARGQLDLALAAADQAVRLDPTMPAAYQVRATIRLAKGDRAGAAADMERAKQLAK